MQTCIRPHFNLERRAMKSKLNLLFLISIALFGFTQTESFAEDVKNETQSENPLKREIDKKDMILYLRSFGLAEGRAVRIRPYFENETANGYEEETRKALALRLAPFGRYEASDETSYEVSGKLFFDINSAHENSFDFIAFAYEEITKRDADSPDPQYLTGGIRFFRYRPDKHIYNAQGQPYLRLTERDLVEVDIPMPVWQVGTEGVSPVRVLFGPRLTASIVNHSMHAKAGLKDTASNQTLDHLHAQYGGRLESGVNLLFIFGKDPNTAWQLGGSYTAQKERSWETGTDKHKIFGDGFSLFLYSPEYELFRPNELEKGYPTQFFIKYTAEDLSIDTYTGEDVLGNPNLESKFEKYDIQEFDYERESLEWGMLIRF